MGGKVPQELYLKSSNLVNVKDVVKLHVNAARSSDVEYTVHKDNVVLRYTCTLVNARKCKMMLSMKTVFKIRMVLKGVIAIFYEILTMIIYSFSFNFLFKTSCKNIDIFRIFIK